MKVAIHHTPGSFSDRWIDYCINNSIPYKIVNAFDSDIVERLDGCDAFMWHHHHAHFKDVLTAKRILFALEHSGLKVFPNFKTGWYFDDKVAQKYFLEAIEAPLVPSYVFYDRDEALKWVNKTVFPKVFKLKGGAGSLNVKLIKTKKSAIRIINRAFKNGFSQHDRLEGFRERLRKYKVGQEDLVGLIKGGIRLFIPTNYSKQQSRERGYAYFQDFIPGLKFDIRVQVIGKRICALKRYVRENDFRASGSGNLIELGPEDIDDRILKLALKIQQKVQSQSLTIDFILDGDNPLVVELSYGFPEKFYDNCQGFWDENLVWHNEKFNPQYWMVENLLLS
ncbi:RimK-like ATP-grasp domain-containing protein [Idiomarina fontislapidosi]|uniref:ATP-grasp fold RimK-type domain-containing protein n=1 Tax=Idiomarina fontislapidosi TaxID=263723 RepID=A0A432XHU4_9GAMM|nr:hypothetical protein [Idiomarina fontislapidosi]PYE29932.1 RimK-like ATP-grasp domain-containing protein [Idiomarina fontislapidosi]RUO48303.1 hypothetical protein CWE25_13265 [Idiomarina fontislapidosi]